MSVASEKTSTDAWKELTLLARFGVRKPGEFTWRERLLYRATAAAARTFVRVATDSCRWVDAGGGLRHDILCGHRHVLFVLWHNRVPGFFPWLASISRRDWRFRCDAVISSSKDGELLARPIRELGGLVVRGSSSRDAAAALRGAVQSASEGACIATVGDGPRGPRYRLKPGVLLVAKATGLPIVPLTWACTAAAQMHRSWDQTLIPLPFSRITMKFGEALTVPPDADADGIAAARTLLEARMNELTKWADENTRVAWQIPRPKPGEVLKRRKPVDLEGRHVA